MKRKLCCLISAVLAFSICMPVGALEAVALDNEGSTSSASATQESPATSIENSENSRAVVNAEAPMAQDEWQVSQSDTANGSKQTSSTGTVDLTRMIEPVDLNTSHKVSKRAASGSSGVELPNVVTSAKVTTATGTTPVNVGAWQAFKLNFHYALPNLGVHAGDTTTIELPAGFKSAPPTDFVIKDGSGSIIARGKTDPTNTKFIITYTDYAEGKSDISGDFSVNVQIDNDVHTHSGVLPVNPVISGETVPAGTVNYTVHTETAVPIIKSGWANAFDTTKGVWQVKINQDGKAYTNAVLDDSLLTPGVSFIPGTLEVFEGTWQLQGTSYKLVGQTNVTSQYASKITYNGTNFKLNLGNIPATKGLLVCFQTKINYTPLPGEKFENKASLTDNGVTKESKAYYLLPTSGGTGEGYKYKINIKKTDESGNPLAGAVFDIVRARSGAVVGQVTTNASGEASLGGLLRDGYIIKETTPPSGYLAAADQTIADTDFSTATQDVTRTFVDKAIPPTVNVSVEKMWSDADNQDGMRPTSVTVHLYADGVDTGKTVTLDGSNSWKDTFTNLDKTNAAGTDIVYTVTEDPTPSGYTAVVTGSVTSGFTITNTHTPETINIPVTKKWVGPEGSSVTVKLLADGVDSGKSVTLSSANSWSDTFTNLPKYKNGTAITYTVDESSVTGVDATKYTTAVSGSATAGFTITNTNTEKIDISGTKTWNDDGNRDGARPSSITINLLADGIQVDSKAVTADASGNWTYSFAGLAKYSATDGHQIAYTITENAVADYSTTITDYDVTNTHTPAQTSLTVTKAWSDDNDRDGVRPSSVEVVLYANGVAKGTPVTLNAANNWSYTWTGLDQKDNGTNIVYTVDEPTVPTGYTKAVTGDATSGFTITNTHTPTPPEPGPNPAPEPDPTPAPSPDPDPDPNGKEVASILPKTADEGTLFAGAAGLAILSAVGGAVAVTARRREEQD